MAQSDGLTSGEAASEPIEVRRIEVADVLDALRAGLDDFMARPSHYAFVVVVYPVIGLAMFAWVARGSALHLIYPLVSGFALLGPVAALGLYEISRRRERGLDTAWSHAFAVTGSPAIPAIAAVGLWLLVLFGAWILVAGLIYDATFGGVAQTSLRGLAADVLTTPSGWMMLLVGNAVGFLFALLALCTTVVAFPLLLDREVGAIAAVRTSARAVARSPGPLMVWGLIVAGSMFLGAVPALIGLIVVLPVLGHATWHIYRKVVPAAGRRGPAGLSARAPAARPPAAPSGHAFGRRSTTRRAFPAERSTEPGSPTSTRLLTPTTLLMW